MTSVFKATRLGALAAVVLTGAAMLLYPGGTFRDPSTRGYAFFQNSLSDLGSAVAWNGQSNTAAVICFAAAGIMLALAGAGCLLQLAWMDILSPRHAMLARWATLIGGLACTGLAVVVLVPEDRYPTTHGRLSLLSIAALALTTFLLAVAASADRRVRRRLPVAWLALTFVTVAWLFTMTSRSPDPTVPVTLQKVVALTLVATLLLQTHEAERRGCCSRN